LEIGASLSHNLDDSNNTPGETTENHGQRTAEGEVSYLALFSAFFQISINGIGPSRGIADAGG
jgi:hypothetical protein